MATFTISTESTGDVVYGEDSVLQAVNGFISDYAISWDNLPYPGNALEITARESGGPLRKYYLFVRVRHNDEPTQLLVEIPISDRARIWE